MKARASSRSKGGLEAGVPPRRGALVAGRYRLRRRLGRGGFGEVWEAEDALRSKRRDPSGSTVAVKIVRSGMVARTRQEISLLRHLHVPGVVQLLDEGVDGDLPFIVMEKLEGSAFPGEGRGGDWESVEEPAIALLETLARVHAMGVVHRDLKPDNVLVDARGRPTILDFGIARDERRDERLTMEGSILGSPRYLAPEQILGDPVSSRTDLYGVGLLLYEALSGEVPHADSSSARLLRARISRLPQPVRTVASHVPDVVARLVDRLLSPDPMDRPASALEALGMLGKRGREGPSVLARLGGDAVAKGLAAAARGGRSADVGGAPGGGQDRCLREAAKLLAEGQTRCLWTRPGRGAFESLEPITGPLEDSLPSLDEAARAVEERVRASLSSGAVILVEDADLLDGWSASVLDRCRRGGAILRGMTERASPDTVSPADFHLAPFEVAELLPLFRGPERILHRKSDAARLLWARTGGLATCVDDEIDAWIRARVARWDGDTLVVEREAMDRVEAGVPVLSVAPAALGTRGARGVPARFHDLAGWVSIAWPHAHPSTLARAMGEPLWRVQAALEELVHAGFARLLPDGRAEPLLAAPMEQLWPSEKRRAAHRALADALQPGQEGRFRHLLAISQLGDLGSSEAADEASHAALRLAHEGYLGGAVAVLHEGLLLARDSLSSGGAARRRVEERLLTAWLSVATSEGTSSGYDRLLYEISRAGASTPYLTQLEALVRAAVASFAGGDRALRQLARMKPLPDIELERHRRALMAAAARRCPASVEERVLSELAVWVDASGDASTRTRFASWMGRLRYRQGRFAEAAEMYARVAEGEPGIAARTAANVYRASALAEAFDHAGAAALARGALAEVQRVRLPLLEARAEWVLRVAQYRMGVVHEPDRELVEASTHLGARDFEATLCLNEAAVAYRAGLYAEAAALAEKSFRVWAFVGTGDAVTLARCLFLAASGVAPPRAEERRLVAEAAECSVPGLGIQALALLSRARGEAPRGSRAAAAVQARLVPREHWSKRMDVLSVDECLDALGQREADIE